MTEFVATIIFVSIMLVGSIVWIIALCFALRIGKPSANREWGSNAESTLAESTLADSTFGLNTGETVCDASKAELMEHIPKVLRRQSLGVLNSVFKLDAKSDQELLLTRHGPLMCNLPTALYFSKVRFRLESTSLKQTRVRYTIDQVDSMRVIKRIAMLILFCVGLPVLLGVGLLVWYIVIPSKNLAVRGQVFQTFQIVHAIWLPFLFIGIAFGAKRSSKLFIERVLMIASDPELMMQSPGFNALGKQTAEI